MSEESKRERRTETAQTAGRASPIRERPILFSAPMVRAILAGRKTVTRRIVDLERLRVFLPRAVSPDFGMLTDCPSAPPGVHLARIYDQGAVAVRLGERCLGVKPDEFEWVSPYGVPRDRLWVRETVRWNEDYKEAVFAADGAPTVIDTWPWQRPVLPGIHMPRGVSRITLEVVSARVERLHAIDEADAMREGVTGETDVPPGYTSGLGVDPTADRGAFAHLWEQINGKRAPWSSNPWVWRVEFRRAER